MIVFQYKDKRIEFTREQLSGWMSKDDGEPFNLDDHEQSEAAFDLVSDQLTDEEKDELGQMPIKWFAGLFT